MAVGVFASMIKRFTGANLAEKPASLTIGGPFSSLGIATGPGGLSVSTTATSHDETKELDRKLNEQRRPLHLACLFSTGREKI